MPVAKCYYGNRRFCVNLPFLLSKGSNSLLKLAYLILDISTVEDPPSARRTGMSLNKWNQAKDRLCCWQHQHYDCIP